MTKDKTEFQLKNPVKYGSSILLGAVGLLFAYFVIDDVYASNTIHAFIMGICETIIVVLVVGILRSRLIISNEYIEQRGIRPNRIYFNEVTKAIFSNNGVQLFSERKVISIGVDIQNMYDAIEIVKMKLTNTTGDDLPLPR